MYAQNNITKMVHERDFRAKTKTPKSLIVIRGFLHRDMFFKV